MHAFGAGQEMETAQWFGHGKHAIKIMKSLFESNYHTYANLPGAVELRESSYRRIGKQLGVALLGEGVAAANEGKRFLLVCCPWASSALGSAGHS